MSELKLETILQIHLELLEDIKKDFAQFMSISPKDQIEARLTAIRNVITEEKKTDEEIFGDKVFDFAGEEIKAGDDDGDDDHLVDLDDDDIE